MRAGCVNFVLVVGRNQPGALSGYQGQSPWLVWLLACALAGTLACGKKGAPLPPLQRIPVAPPDLSVVRIENEAYARFTVPTTNVDGVSPADVARVELYAITAERPPQVEDPEDLRKLSTLVGTEQVRRPLPPPPPVKEGMPPVPLPPPGPGVDQGATIVMREALTADAHKVVALPGDDLSEDKRDEQDAVPRPLVAPSEGGGPQRYYYAVAVSARGRHGPPSGVVPAPLGPTSTAPGQPEISISEKAVTIKWAPSPDARGIVETGGEDLLPSKPTMPGPPPTTYDVYEVPRNATADAPTLTFPTPLTPAPVAALAFTQQGITLGQERCFVVRPVDIVNGTHVRGPASPMVCESFADTFAPPPPGRLDAVASPGMISLIWEPTDAPDLAGYIVLRGEAGGATLTPLKPDPAKETSYRDESVKPGVRYVYAIVAVDNTGNRSGESNRVEETAR
jgi:hypothetical protein